MTRQNQCRVTLCAPVLAIFSQSIKIPTSNAKKPEIKALDAVSGIPGTKNIRNGFIFLDLL